MNGGEVGQEELAVRGSKKRVVIACMLLAALIIAGGLFLVLRKSIDLFRYQILYLRARSDAEARNIAKRLAQRFSTRTLISVAGNKPKSRWVFSVAGRTGGAAELALGLQNTRQSIAALEALLAESQEGRKRGDEDALHEWSHVVSGLAHASSFEYGSLYDRYADDSRALYIVALEQMRANRCDCHEEFVEYLKRTRAQLRLPPVAEMMKEYCERQGLDWSELKKLVRLPKEE